MSVAFKGVSGYEKYQQKRAAEAEPNLMPGDLLSEYLEQQMADDEERRIAFMDWSLRIPEPKTGTLDFDRFPFQRELYTEGVDDQEQIVKKSTQLGISAFLVRWTMYWADVRGLTAIYLFPKSKQMYDHSDARIRPLILHSDYLRGRVTGTSVQNKGLKAVGLGLVYYRGSESIDDLESVDADVLALDENDNLTQANIPIVERRLSGSQHAYIRRVGVPSIPQFGIAKMYDESDQRQWHVKCSGCGEWQPINFQENIDQKRLIRICRKCAKQLDVAKGEWVATYPDRSVRGYHISRLIAPSANLEQIVKASKKRTPYEVQTFYNRDLGEEYAPEEGRLSPQAIAAAQREFTMVPGYVGDHPVTMGVDVASVRQLNVRISEHFAPRHKRCLWVGTVDNFDELALLMDRYQVNLAAIDAMPEHRLARAFAERFAGRVYLVHYTGGQTKEPLSVDEEQRRVSVRRVEVIDAAMQQIREQRNQLPLDLPEDYVQQMMAVVRKIERDELDKVVVSYVSVGPDDYLHCEAFGVVAWEMYSIRQALVEAQNPELRPLEDFMEWSRSDVADPNAQEYRNPMDGDLYEPGPEESW